MNHNRHMLRMILNAALVYAMLVILVRLTGKRQLGELEVSELIVTILISEVAATPIVHPDTPLLSAFLPVLTLLGMEYLLSVLCLRSVRLRAVLSGKPAMLIVHGRIDQTQMRKNRITPDELAEAMRGCGSLDIRDIQYAILETDGRISIIPTPAQRPATAGQMGVTEEDRGYPVIVVNNGRILTENLKLLGRDERWLAARLKENGLTGPEQVFMMTADMTGGIFLAPLERD